MIIRSENLRFEQDGNICVIRLPVDTWVYVFFIYSTVSCAIVNFENYTDVKEISLSHTNTLIYIYILYIYIVSLTQSRMSIIGQQEMFCNITFLPP